jgi:hypothetical protein
LSLLENHGTGANDLVLLGSHEGVEEDIVADTDGSEELGKTVPHSSMFVMCASCNYSITGSFSSNNVSHELILLGSSAL